MIISIIGAKGSGKNTVADMMICEAYKRSRIQLIEKSFALPLKDMLWEMFGSQIKDPGRIYGIDSAKNEEILSLPVEESYRVRYPAVLGDKKFWTGRLLMQIFGTEIFRGVYDPIWVEKAIESARKTFSRTGDVRYGVIFTDCRFSNENEALYNLGLELRKATVTIKVTRPSLQLLDQHASEQGYEKMDVDYDLMNSGTLADLENLVQEVLDDLFGPRSAEHASPIREETLC